MLRFLSNNTKATLMVRFLAITKIPLMFFCRPKILSISDESVTVFIPFKRRTKNHVGSMYFGALAIGADLAGGYLAMHHINKSKSKVKLIFKDFNANFLKRAEGDVHFICNDGKKIKSMIEKTVATGDRVNEQVVINAFVPDKFNDEPVAKFIFTLSLK